MKYVVDIDGTICEHVEQGAARKGAFGTGKVYYDRIEKINQLFDEGHTIISVSYTHLTLPTNREV